MGKERISPNFNGQIFGKLEVISFSHKGTNKRFYYKCICHECKKKLQLRGILYEKELLHVGVSRAEKAVIIMLGRGLVRLVVIFIG